MRMALINKAGRSCLRGTRGGVPWNVAFRAARRRAAFVRLTSVRPRPPIGARRCARCATALAEQVGCVQELCLLITAAPRKEGGGGIPDA